VEGKRERRGRGRGGGAVVGRGFVGGEVAWGKGIRRLWGQL